MLLKFLVILSRSMLRVAVERKDLSQFKSIINLLNSVDKYERDDELEKMKHRMFYGFVGWIFAKLANEPIIENKEIYKEMILAVLNCFRVDFSDWLNLFIETMQLDNEDSWGCGDWDLPHD